MYLQIYGNFKGYPSELSGEFENNSKVPRPAKTMMPVSCRHAPKGCLLKRNVQFFLDEILLIEEILHQLIGSLSHYLQGFWYMPGGAGFLPSTV